MEPEIVQVRQPARGRVLGLQPSPTAWPSAFLQPSVSVFPLARYYLFTLLLSLTRDLYELRLLMEREERSKAPKSSSPAQAEDPPVPPTVSLWARRRLHLLVTVLYGNPPLLLDLLKNACDIFIPLDRLGVCPTGPGLVGACGLASSLLSILTIVQPWLKLKP